MTDSIKRENIKRENLLGIGFITLAMAAFAVEDSLIKLLSTRLSSGQILLMIGVGGTLGFYIWSRHKEVYRKQIFQMPGARPDVGTLACF